jgi:hypothetical protein
MAHFGKEILHENLAIGPGGIGIPNHDSCRTHQLLHKSMGRDQMRHPGNQRLQVFGEEGIHRVIQQSAIQIKQNTSYQDHFSPPNQSSTEQRNYTTNSTEGTIVGENIS